MRIKMPWIVDPVNNKPSVSLTNLVVSILFLLVAGSLDLAGRVKNPSIAWEYFATSSVLYFGRRAKFLADKLPPMNPTDTSEPPTPST